MLKNILNNYKGNKMNRAKKILIVEDDVILVRMYTKKFEHEGFEVVAAYSGGEGLAQAAKEKPDLILLDIMMPAMDGFAVIRELKEDLSLRNTPIVILTNLGTSDIFIQEAKRLGVEDYLIKYKVAAKDVVAKVKSLVGEDQKS
jgi:CheY-like chemotaxis protein